jgi:hypothetical protein
VLQEPKLNQREKVRICFEAEKRKKGEKEENEKKRKKN